MEYRNRHGISTMLYINYWYLHTSQYAPSVVVVDHTDALRSCSRVRGCHWMHFWHLSVTKSFGICLWRNHPNTTTHTPSSEACIDSSSSIRNHDTNYSTHIRKHEARVIWHCASDLGHLQLLVFNMQYRIRHVISTMLYINCWYLYTYQ